MEQEILSPKDLVKAVVEHTREDSGREVGVGQAKARNIGRIKAPWVQGQGLAIGIERQRQMIAELDLTVEKTA